MLAARAKVNCVGLMRRPHAMSAPGIFLLRQSHAKLPIPVHCLLCRLQGSHRCMPIWFQQASLTSNTGSAVHVPLGTLQGFFLTPAYPLVCSVVCLRVTGVRTPKKSSPAFHTSTRYGSATVSAAALLEILCLMTTLTLTFFRQPLYINSSTTISSARLTTAVASGATYIAV